MNILNELTIKNLKQNRKRTLVTIFGIVLSVALVTAITTFVSSIQQSMVEHAREMNGNYHIMVSDVPLEKQKYLLNNEKVEKAMTGRTLASMKFELTEEQKAAGMTEPQIKLKAFDGETFRQIGMKRILVKGALPSNENEVLYPLYLNGFDKEYKVGDHVTLNVGGAEKTYKISGMITSPSFEFKTGDGNGGYTFLTRSDKKISGETMEIALLMKNPRDVYPFFEELKEEHGFTDEQLVVNDSLLRFQGVLKTERTMKILYSIAAVVISIIVFTSVFVIKNSFDISITERMKQYGMLVSVGATSRQIRKNVRFEGLILGLIAIPAGVLCGIAAIGITLRIVMKILEGGRLAAEYTLTLHVSLWAVLAAVLVAALTIYLSTLIPAGKAAKVSPIEAIRESGNIKISNKKLRTPKIIQRVLGVEGEIADKNLKRSRKKYRTTVFSIFLSVVLFVSISSVIKYGFMVQELQYQKRDFNLEVHLDSGDMTREEEYALCQRVAKLDGIKQVFISRLAYAQLKNGDYTKEAIGNKENGYRSPEELDEATMLDIYALPDRDYREYVKDLGLSYKEADGRLIIADSAIKEYYDKDQNLRRIKYNQLNSKAGDVLHVKVFGTGEEEDQSMNWEIAKRTDKLPFGIEHHEFANTSITVIISEKMMSTLSWRMNGLRIDAENPAKLGKAIVDSAKEITWHITDYEEEANESNSIILIFSIFLYGFIAVISAIGITNVFNTITTNMTLRSREFAILKSIGMTDREFRRMIRYESVLYGIKALLFGIPVGVALSYLMYRLFIGIMVVPYQLPWEQIGIAVLGVFAVIFLTMGYSVRKTKNQNIIETIRSENI